MKKTKVLISLILSIVMISSFVVPTLAAGIFGGDECDCGHAPIVQVRGIGETLYDEFGNEIFSTQNIIDGILPVIPDLASFLLTQDVSAFVNAAETAVKAIFQPVMYNNNGERENVVKVNRSSEPFEKMDTTNLTGSELTLAEMAYEELGDNHSYYFNYDWTANPFDVADQLHEFIQEVKEKSGHSKVTLCAESMGGAIVNIYMSKYATSLISNDVESIVMANSAFNGLEMMGQLFTGNIQIDSEALAALIVQEITNNPEYEALLPYSLLFEQLALMANDIATAAKTELYQRIFIPVFAYMPSFWLFVPEEYYEDATDFLLQDAGSGLKGIVNNYGLILGTTKNRFDYYRSNLGGNTSLYIVSNYNRYMAPVTPASQMNSDGVIETKNTSAFATVADMGMTLDDTAPNNNYIQANSDGYNRISPDRVIDASTCWYPDQTWFIKNLGHVAYDEEDGTGKFYIWLLTSTEEYTVRTSAEYPQFMYYDTGIPELMTYQEHLDNDQPNDGILDGFLPDFNVDNILGAITGGIESILGSIGGIGGGEGSEGGLDINLDGVLGGLGDVVGIIGGVGDLLGGLLGGLGGGSGSTPAPDNSGEEEIPEEAPAPETPSTPEAPSTNTGSTGGTASTGNTGSASTGGSQSNAPVQTVEHESTYNLWMALLIAIAVIVGVLLIVL